MSSTESGRVLGDESSEMDTVTAVAALLVDRAGAGRQRQWWTGKQQHLDLDIDREFEFYEFFSFLKFNEFYEIFFRLKKIRKKFVISQIIDV